MGYAERLAGGLKAQFVAQIVFAGSNIVLVLLLTRYLLSPAEFGLLQFALSVLAIAAVLGSLGIPKSTARYLTEYVERDPTQVRFILTRSTLYVVGVVAVVSAALGLASVALADLLGAPKLAPLLLVGVAYVPLYALWSYLATVFQGFNRIAMSGFVTALGGGVGRVLFAVAFALLGFGVIGVLFGYVVGFAVAILVGGLVLYWRFYRPFEPTESPEPGLGRRILEYSVPLTATKGANVLDSRIDSILVGVLLNPTAVGFYVIARQVADSVTIPASSFGYTLSPALGEQKARNRAETAARLYERSLMYVLLFYVPAAAGLVLTADPIVRFVFGSAYLGAVPVLQVLGIYVVVHAVNKITSSGLDYLGLARDRAIAMMAMAVANVALNLLLIPRMGVAGAAVATVATYSAYTFVNVYTIHRELDLRIGLVLRHAGQVGLISAVMTVGVIAATPYITDLASLLGVVALGGGVWAVLAVASGMLDVRRLAALLI